MCCIITVPNFYYKNSISASTPTIPIMEFTTTLEPIQMSIGDRVKLNATVLINIFTIGTMGNDKSASYNSIFVIERLSSIPPGVPPMTSKTLISTKISDTNLNSPATNPSTLNPFTRLVNLSWIDTPPDNLISQYTFRVTNTTTFNVFRTDYTSIRLNALVFHNN